MNEFYQQQYYNNNMNNNQLQNNNNQAQYNRKRKGLNIYQIPIFTAYNPRNGIVEFYINGKTGDLQICMAPAIPNNPAINMKGPVPKGIKVYDYDKKVYSNFSDVDTVDFIYFLKNKFQYDLSTFSGFIVNTNNTINDLRSNLNNIINDQILTQIKQNNEYAQKIYSILLQIMMKIDDLKNIGDKLMIEATAKKNNNENQFSLYRKDDKGNKAWNFNYDANTNMLHISVMIGDTKDNRFHISLSNKMVARLISVIDSYTSNYGLISMIANQSLELSKTLAYNNLCAPDNKDSDNFS